jgi:hypothetical protein
LLFQKVEDFGREMYKNVKIFQVMKKEAEKEKKAASRRIKDSKDKEEEDIELAAVKVAQTVQQQIKDFKVCSNRNIYLELFQLLYVLKMDFVHMYRFTVDYGIRLK